jgi:hypothetical protein
MQIKYEKMKLTNPQGLDEILSEILSRQIHGDWDEDIPAKQDIGTIEKTAVSRTTGVYWGMMMEAYARKYLSRNLKELGWNVESEMISGREYDCIGRKEGSPQRTAELAVEMYFPQPKIQANAEYYSAHEHSTKMIRKLTTIKAKHKYVLIGVPRDIVIDVTILPHPTIKTVYQEHKFKELLFLDEH